MVVDSAALLRANFKTVPQGTATHTVEPADVQGAAMVVRGKRNDDCRSKTNIVSLNDSYFCYFYRQVYSLGTLRD